MRLSPAALIAALLLAGCDRTPAARDATLAAAAAAAPDSVVEYLLASAAGDFHAHGPRPSRFREVRLGQVVNDQGEKQYLLCGSVLPSGEGGKAGAWIPFATIKTSAYEQWIGGHPLCQSQAVTWQDEDLSGALQRRVEGRE